MKSIWVLSIALCACAGRPEPAPDLPTSGGGVMGPTEPAPTAPDPTAPAPAEPAPNETAPTDAVPPAVPPDPDDPRSPETIRRVIYGNHQNIIACGDGTTAREPVSGKVMVAFRVEADGTVGEVSLVDREIDDPGFKSCLQKEIGALRFPPAPARLTVRYPFNFKGRTTAPTPR